MNKLKEIVTIIKTEFLKDPGYTVCFINNISAKVCAIGIQTFGGYYITYVNEKRG